MTTKKIKRDYPGWVIKVIQDYFEYNECKKITEDHVRYMEPYQVLDIYLEWEGILGYTSTIWNICNAKESFWN